MALDTVGLRDLMIELLDVWDSDGRPTQMSQPRARSGRAITATDLARMECVVGLARHVHETARAVSLLLDHKHYNAAAPLVRLMYECALTAIWLVQSENDDGVNAFMHEYARQQVNLASTLKRSITRTFRDGGATIPNTDVETFLGSTDNARRFDLICEDLAPGGTDAYIYYKALSRLSHAGVPVVDIYFAPPPRGSNVPPQRPKPAVRLDENLLAFLANASMVWSGRSVSYISKNTSYRSALRRAAKQLAITSEIQLSDTYRLRHADARRRARAGES